MGAARERVDVQHRGLRQRRQRGAEHALQQAEAHQLFQRLRRAAQHGGDGEARDADDEQSLAAEADGHPADRGGHDGGRDHVGREHPGDLVVGCRHAALHIGQRHVRDGGIQRLHEHRQHSRGGEQAAVRNADCVGHLPWTSTSGGIVHPDQRQRHRRSCEPVLAPRPSSRPRGGGMALWSPRPIDKDPRLGIGMSEHAMSLETTPDQRRWMSHIPVFTVAPTFRCPIRANPGRPRNHWSLLELGSAAMSRSISVLRPIIVASSDPSARWADTANASGTAHGRVFHGSR